MRMLMYGIFRQGTDCPKDWQYLGPRTVDGYTIYTMGPQGIAYARPFEGGKLNGDLYEVPDQEILHYIDQVEGHPSWYRRTQIVTTAGDSCQMYVQQLEVEKRPGFARMGADWIPALL